MPDTSPHLTSAEIAITRARKLASIADIEGMHGYLTEVGSPFAGNSEDTIVYAAFMGHMDDCLITLARYLEPYARTEGDELRKSYAVLDA